MSEHEFKPPADPGAGFDPGEPQAKMIAIFAGATVVLLAVVILAIQAYFDRVYQQQVYEKVLEPPSEQLRDLHAREDSELYSYKYIDRTKGLVRLPIERAMELLAKEAAEDRLPYPTKPTAPKPETPTAPPAPGN